MNSLKTKQWTINVSSLCKARLFSRQEARPNSRSFCRGLVAFLMVTLLVSGGFSQNPVANGVALDDVKIDRVQDRTTGIIEGNVFEDVNADGQLTPIDIPICGIPIEIKGPLDIIVVETDDDGVFQVELPTDADYVVSLRDNAVEHDITVPGGEGTRLVETRGGNVRVQLIDTKPVAVNFVLRRPCPRGATETQVFEAGAPDKFSPGNDEPASPGLGLQNLATGCLGWVDFDYSGCDRCFGHSFRLPRLARPCFVQGARLRIGLRANACSLVHNDTLLLGKGGNSLWSTSIKQLNGGIWGAGAQTILNLDLSSLPGPGATSSNIISNLQTSGTFDIFVQDDTSVDFVRLELDICCPATIHGYKFDDVDANGFWDAGEPPIENWEINISAPGFSTSVTTDANGYYSYTTSVAGVHQVKEVQQTNWIQTTPVVTYTVNTTGNVSHGPLNFGNYWKCDDDEIFQIVEDRGIPDKFNPGNDEPTTPSAELVDAYDTSTFVDYDSDRCDAFFLETINFDVPEGCVVVGAKLSIRLNPICAGTSASQTDALNFFDGGTVIWGDSLNDLTANSPWNSGPETITLDLANLNPNGAGVGDLLSWLQDGELGIMVQDDTAVDSLRLVVDICCPCQPGTVCLVKYDDLNGNRVRDAGEPGIPNWEFQLFGPTLNVQVFTDADGRVCVDKLPPGTYTVIEIQQNGWVQTSPATVSQTIEVCVRPNDPQGVPPTLEFGNCRDCEKPRSVLCPAGREDGFATADGIEKSTPSAALLARLQNCSSGALTQFDVRPGNKCFGHTFKKCWGRDCKVVGATLTIGLCAGSSFLANNDTLTILEGATTVWQQPIANLTANGWGANDCTVLTLDLENLPPSSTFVTNVLAALQDGDLDIMIQDDTGVDFADLQVDVCCPGSICGTKWNDVNADEVRQAFEPGLQGWTIELRDLTGAVVATTVTDANGNYCFQGLEAGSYRVLEVQQAPWTQTFPDTVYHPVTLNDGEQVTLDFGNTDECKDNLRHHTCVAEAPSPDLDLAQILKNCSGGMHNQFGGQPPVDRCIGHTFRECWPEDCTVVGAFLRVGLESSNSSLAFNDTLSFYDGSNGIWGNPISALTGAGWGANQAAQLVLDLSNLPPNAFGITNVLASLQDGDFSVAVQDDTGITSLELDLVLCCPGCDHQYSLDCQFDPTNPDSAVHLSWAPAPPEGCCNEIVIRGGPDADGPVVVTLPGTASDYTVTCSEILAAGLPPFGVLCVWCENGTDELPVRIGCCDYSCSDCPPLDPKCEYDATKNEICVSWTPQSQNCCPEVQVIEPISGVILGVFGAGDGGPVCIPCSELVSLTGGKTSGVLCVECIKPDGTTSRECCEWDCGGCEPSIDLSCDVQTGVGVGLTWNPNLTQDCCSRIEIRVPQSPTLPDVVLANFPIGLVNSTFIDCKELVAATGKTSGVVCVVCVSPDGTETVECCDWSCPCDPLEILRCHVTDAGDFVITWDADPNCCDELELAINGVVVANPDLSTGSFSVPCEKIKDMTGTTSGVVCLRCIRDGSVVEEVCCDFSCPECDEDTIELDIRCTRLEGPGGGQHEWGVSYFLTGGEDCCDMIQIRVDGKVVFAQPGKAAPVSVTIDCDDFGHGVHTVCVQCVDSEGNVKAQACCEIECGPGKGLVPGDCDGNGLVDFSDAVCILTNQFLGFPKLPCGDGTLLHPSNISLLDFDLSGNADFTDAVAQLTHLFLGGAPRQNFPKQDCVSIPECPQVCDL